jgi:photosystem II stability/assembly factor-like uncharacterized protein
MTRRAATILAIALVTVASSVPASAANSTVDLAGKKVAPLNKWR